MSSNVIPRRRRSAAMRMASSSEVVVREVAKRKWSTRSSPRNIPKWVWVLPTSMVRSTRGLSESFEPVYALPLERGERPFEPRTLGRVELQQRLEHETTLLDLGMGHLQVGVVHPLPLDHQQVDVERPRRVPRRVRIASQLQLDPLGRGEQPTRG